MEIPLCHLPLNRSNSTVSHQQINLRAIYVEWVSNSISLVIFVLALIGNAAALIVMFGSKGSVRLTNNKYLANLACADLLRACFMPFTIIARMKKNFIFGKMICQILPIVQGVSVAVDIFTLVGISIERYLAICRPLLILKLQSIQFSNLLNAFILFFIWSFSLLIALPNLFTYNLCSLPKSGRYKCERINTKLFDVRIYMIILDVFYFLIPIVIMMVLYTLIIWKMYRNSTAARMRSFTSGNTSKVRSNLSSSQLSQSNRCSHDRIAYSDANEHKGKEMFANELDNYANGSMSNNNCSMRPRSILTDDDSEQAPQIRKLLNSQDEYLRFYSSPQDNSSQNNKLRKNTERLSFRSIGGQSHSSLSQGLTRMDRHRRKALKLLIVLIVEFFVCWTPLFIYHTIGTFQKSFYSAKSSIYIDVILLFSFASASCNPLTYYFMSKRYRSVLYAYLSCAIRKKSKSQIRYSMRDSRSCQQNSSKKTHKESLKTI